MDQTQGRRYAIIATCACFLAWYLCLFLSPSAFPLGILPSALIVARVSFLLSSAFAFFCIARLPMMRIAFRKASFSAISLACTTSGVFIASVSSLLNAEPAVQLIITVCGYFLVGSGSAVLLLNAVWHFANSADGRVPESMTLIVALSSVVYLLVSNLASYLAFLLTLLLPLGVLLCCYFRSSDEGASIQTTLGSNCDESSSVVPMKWGTALNTGCFWLAFGLVWSFAVASLSEGGYGLQSLSALIALMAIVLSVALVLLKRRLKASHAVVAILPVLAIGISCAIYVSPSHFSLVFALIFVSRALAETELIAHFIELCKEGRASMLVIFSCSFAVLSLAEALGVLIGSFIGSFQIEPLLFALMLIINALVILLVLTITHVNKKIQANAIQARAIAEAAADQRLQREEKIQAIANRYGMTKRETEVLDLILQGRNVPHMAEKLCISQSTVQTHVKHIYTKAGVRNRQSLLDLIAEMEA